MAAFTVSTLLVVLVLGVTNSDGYSHGRFPPGGKKPRPPQLIGNEDRLPNDDCGRTGVIGKSIVGGRPAVLREFPWMALIGYIFVGTTGPVTWLCGGSLITNQYVLTAAHCLHPKDIVFAYEEKLYARRVSKVRLGELDQTPSADDGATPEDYDVAGIIVHGGWNRTIMINDIGIIKLNRTVTFTDLVRPICLPQASVRSLVFTSRDKPTVAGWGKLSFNSSGSMKLMTVRVRVRDLDQCRANYVAKETPDQPTFMDNSVLCAGSSDKGTCQGDSGGPLMYYYEDLKSEDIGRWYQIGVVSYGPEVCVKDGLPGVYTRVSEHMPWILANLDL